MNLHIGTSGWHYKHWIGRYYPDDLKQRDMLGYYARDFDTVELNNTFYHLPKAESLDSWRDGTPREFEFAVKGSRFLTHMLKLKDPERGLHNFFERVDRLGPKLGPILWQLPPRWNVNYERLETFLGLLPRKHRYAFELRNESWMSDEILALLRKHDAAFCIYELAGYHTPIELTAGWTYIRLHGPTAFKYQGSYEERQLREWARRIESWSRKLRDVYVYFDNDDSAFAVDNARKLRELLGIDAHRAKRTA